MSFKQIKGNERAAETLKRYLTIKRVAGGFLFTGPDGVGKKLFAKVVAKAVNCATRSDDCCETCAPCTKIEKNQHPDVHIIEKGPEAVKIEDVRQLQKDICLKAYEGTKVFIIDDAHNLTAEASNALLKILEEPPSDSILILISSKPALLFRTIVSRCQTVTFHALRRAQLKDILYKEYGLHANLSHFLSYYCEGSIGEALRLKDMDILTQKNNIIDMIALRKNVRLKGYNLTNREEMRTALHFLATWFRDIYVLQSGISTNELIHIDRRSELERYQKRYARQDVERMIRFISSACAYLDQNINVKLLLSHIKAELWRN